MRDISHSVHPVVALLQLLLWVGRFPLLGQHMQELLIGIPILVQSHMIIQFLANLYTLSQLMSLLLTMVIILVAVCTPHTSHTCDLLHPSITEKTIDIRTINVIVILLLLLKMFPFFVFVFFELLRMPEGRCTLIFISNDNFC